MVSLNFQFSSTPILNVLTKKRRNSDPCTGPMNFTSEGLSNPYFNGTAMHTKVNNEMPSRIAIILKRPVLVLSKLIIII